MKPSNFQTFFARKIKTGEDKLTIVLGSGFHKAIGKVSALSSWDVLLKELDPKFQSSGKYLLEFEKIILKNLSNKAAHKVEKKKLFEIAQIIKMEQSHLNDEQLKGYPIEIFNPNYVSDVIVLNFDEVAEEICKKILGCKISAFKYIPIDTKSKWAKVHISTRYREVIFPSKQIIRFWHPHGSVSKPSELILSVRNYANHISYIEQLRKFSKNSTERRKSETWYDKMVHQPVLILGASISYNEWDLWTVFVNRERNFLKKENKKYRSPVFQMRYSVCSGLTDTSLGWFLNLFDEKYSYENQWEMLLKIMCK